MCICFTYLLDVESVCNLCRNVSAFNFARSTAVKDPTHHKSAVIQMHGNEANMTAVGGNVSNEEFCMQYISM